HNQVNLEYLLIPILSNLKKQPNKRPGYAAGNILNLLIQERIEKQQPVLSDHDFSLVDIWQADLSRIFIHNVNFTGANFQNCLFTDIFGTILNVQFSPDGKLFAGGDISE
ncbi:MAG: pentapeptide repeat-containing protein, partial [Dolichospermum sp.]